MKRYSKILNREISDDEVFQIDDYKIVKYYTDCSPNDTKIKHTLKIKFKFDFNDLDAVGNIIYMEELENDHKNTKALGVMNKEKYFFNTVDSEILKLI